MNINMQKIMLKPCAMAHADKTSNILIDTYNIKNIKLPIIDDIKYTKIMMQNTIKANLNIIIISPFI